jgi:hypothetical protein
MAEGDCEVTVFLNVFKDFPTSNQKDLEIALKGLCLPGDAADLKKGIGKNE